MRLVMAKCHSNIAEAVRTSPAKSYTLDEWPEMDADIGQSKGVLEALHNNCTFPNTAYLIVPISPPRKGLHSYHVCNMHRTLEHLKALIFRAPVQIEQQLINRTREAAQNMSPDSK
ncbi:hypothetical protein D910_00128 [Dendroctonus ponderosae]|uniref:Uncharacterized protein n=1 Tax=Dendroctonus ponderosae TaxID=77166 RepID=U4UZ64_DENPD|nr:hypothetical protein D910_00128 [Dendroctonus ponderosae]